MKTSASDMPGQMLVNIDSGSRHKSLINLMLLAAKGAIFFDIDENLLREI